MQSSLSVGLAGQLRCTCAAALNLLTAVLMAAEQGLAKKSSEKQGSWVVSSLGGLPFQGGLVT